MADESPAAKRPRHSLESSVARGLPPVSEFTWKLTDLTVEKFTAAPPDELWTSDEFDACGLRWQLTLAPNQKVGTSKDPAFRVELHLRSRGCWIRVADDSAFTLSGHGKSSGLGQRLFMAGESSSNHSWTHRYLKARTSNCT